MVKHLFSVICIVATLAMMPVAHSIVGLLHSIQGEWIWGYANIAIGFSGFACIWFGLRKPEIQACVLGFIGAHLMFIGFFEFTFALFGSVFGIEPLRNPDTGTVLLSPGLQVNEASFFILLPLFLLFYANRQVQCNMIVWLRKHLRMEVGKPTESFQDRPYARIVASETLFIIWMIYAISLVTLDPRILGPTHWLSMTIYTWFMVWPLYLMYRITKIRVPGAAIRYAIPIGVLLWSWVEMLASTDMIVEYYLHPYDFPVASGLTALAAGALLLLVYRGPSVQRAVVQEET